LRIKDYTHLFRRLLSFVLIGFVFMGTQGYLFFDAAQYQCRQHAQETIDRSAHLFTIVVSADAFPNHHEREIWYGGQLYDIKHYQIKGDRVYLTVYHDSPEEALVADYASSIDEGAGANHEVVKKVRIQPISDYFMPNESLKHECFIAEGNPLYRRVSGLVCSRTSAPLLKPPSPAAPIA
jgi:hypothetical protein